MNARWPQNLWTGPAALSRALIMGTELGQWGAKKILLKISLIQDILRLFHFFQFFLRRPTQRLTF
jgi:hypothetical protein